MRRQTARPPWETGRATGQGPAWRRALAERPVLGAGQPLCADHSPEFLERNRRAVTVRAAGGGNYVVAPGWDEYWTGKFGD